MISQAGLGGGFKDFYFHPYLGKIPILTNIFQMGWNHQLGVLKKGGKMHLRKHAAVYYVKLTSTAGFVVDSSTAALSDCYLDDVTERKKSKSMVRINGLFHLLINGFFSLGYNLLIRSPFTKFLAFWSNIDHREKTDSIADGSFEILRTRQLICPVVYNTI